MAPAQQSTKHRVGDGNEQSSAGENLSSEERLTAGAVHGDVEAWKDEVLRERKREEVLRISLHAWDGVTQIE